MSDEIEVVLFDLGGVLIDFGGVAAMKVLSGIEDDDELWRRWLTCEWVRAFERGDCSPDEFAAGVVADWELATSPSEYLTAFQGWIGDPLPGAHALVERVRATVPTGCLSNTNSLHTELYFNQWIDVFDYRFLSFELGAVKPDRELFDRVAELLPAPPERTIFLDDNLINVEGAIEAGFVARHVRGVDEARAALIDAGIL